jgi:small redox-active disulfide protein 2
MKIEVLGTGCPKCQALAANAKAAADMLGVPYDLSKVTNLAEMMKRGVMVTPALLVDGKLKVSGKVASQAELTTILTDAMAES